LRIFNVIQELKLIRLCCEGASEAAEFKVREHVLNWEVAQRILGMCKDLWPLKIAILDYVNHAFLDSSDKDFLSRKA